MNCQLPLAIDSGVWNTGHCQGIALDLRRGWVYYSFTTMLLKTDLTGRALGSVKGLLGHLGCIAFCEEDGCVYGSLEYKNDAIGKGILKRIGRDAVEDAFYMAIFDGEKIDRMDMDGARDGVMRAAYLSQVVEDYTGTVTAPDGASIPHVHGCSGIDGTSIGPLFGSGTKDKKYLFTAYGVYSDLSRADNDYQVLLGYDLDALRRSAMPLYQEHMHHEGPEKPVGKYFVYTGNTTYGVQNLEYDAYTGDWLMAVYRGKKPEFPNWPMYVVDGGKAPEQRSLKGYSPERYGLVLSLKDAGELHAPTGLRGYTYEWGQTGLFSLGDGRYYVSYDERAEDGWRTTLRLCRWDGVSPIIPVENA